MQALTSMADAMQYVPLTCIPFLLFWVLATNQVRIPSKEMVDIT